MENVVSGLLPTASPYFITTPSVIGTRLRPEKLLQRYGVILDKKSNFGNI